MKYLRLSTLTLLVVLLAAATVVLSQSGKKDKAVSKYTGAPCAEHSIADSLCTRCHPELAAMFKKKGDWCPEHRMPVSQDDLCHPELAKQSLANAMKSGQENAESDNAATTDWCSSHRVPESECTKCNPALVAAFKVKGDWCKTHGVPESHCYQCNPGLSFIQDPKNRSSKIETEAPAAIDWCAEHRIPESQCTKCHPELAAKFKAEGDWCKTHDVPESHCYRCNPDLTFPQEAEYLKQEAKNEDERSHMPAGQPETALYHTNATSCATDKAVVQLSSVETAQRAGLVIEVAQAATLAQTVDAPAEVEFDATSSYAVTSLVGGTLVKWQVQPGEQVRQGQVLAYLQSIEGAALKAECSHALAVLNLSKAAYDRAKTLSKDGMSSLREVQEAEADYLRAQADLRKAAGALKALGMPQSDIDNLTVDDGSSASIPIRAGQSGILVNQRVDLGAVLSPGEPIGLISQTETLWVEAQVRERDFSRLKPGQDAVISSDGQGLNRSPGIVSWVSAEVDPLTRMGKVRIETRPHGNQLKAHQFVHVAISTDASEETVVVPQEAVQWEGCCNVVFVSETRDRFRPRKVTVEFSSGKGYAVSGLKSGEKVVTHGSYMLKTELMKGSIGAGCCGVGA